MGAFISKNDYLYLQNLTFLHKKMSQEREKPKQKRILDYQKPLQWGDFDKLEEDNLGELPSGQDMLNEYKARQNAPATKKKQKKYSQIEAYQKALEVLRKQAKYVNPFGRIRLNIRTMQAIKMLKQAIDKDKQFKLALRHVGCKTRMRMRKKTEARQLFETMLKYLQEGTIPEWMKEKHKELLLKDDSKFDNYMRIDEKQFYD